LRGYPGSVAAHTGAFSLDLATKLLMKPPLEKIVAAKRKEIDEAKQKLPLERIQKSLDLSPKRPFKQTLRKGPGELALIAELKKASPSRGVLRADFRPLEIARIYEEEGASALSVLTDAPHFSGSLAILQEVRHFTPLPVLRKDFILDSYQIYESALAGSDALLLIARLLDEGDLRDFLGTTRALGMDAMVEVHTEGELKKAVGAGAEIVGVNSRDLSTLKVDLRTAERLFPKIPKACTVVAESGIRTHEELARLKDLGVHAVLIGEAFMEAQDIRGKVREIFHGPR